MCVVKHDLCGYGFFIFFFFSSRRRHTRCREVSWARRCVQETDAEYMGTQSTWAFQKFLIFCSSSVQITIAIFGTLCESIKKGSKNNHINNCILHGKRSNT
eukprot:TRINITY_DN21424_c0_g1_i2.p3 TRINITY_DN21424_c0_g1~~TRINITY_DN21424_c0_g1_i2.p3  ORF type:complete len:101 (-),score=41.34 TRINITY_DN21424_c0_g1_i2:444-746(-)